ncbi:hypothetical protein QF028_004625 [Neobacillus sp. B4I6]|uniref:hypothetical protein n=1 Tax=Neobacillus sp. B4I6 TaxID=3373925 RepID=UPI003D1FC526
MENKGISIVVIFSLMISMFMPTISSKAETGETTVHLLAEKMNLFDPNSTFLRKKTG